MSDIQNLNKLVEPLWKLSSF